MARPPFLPAFQPPKPKMTPARYLRLRREAAGLTIEQAAKPFYKNPDHRADCERNLRTFETEGVMMKQYVADSIPRAFPFSPEIYRQLCDEPADRHPRLCRHCGWDEWTQAFDRNGDEIAWYGDEDLCSACHDKLEREAFARAA